ncbi:MAG TPA: tRNA preQ1(34) S-adenosylmethionine ribosyltransferase-isomerase QueA [Chthoniobacterales bacterium]|jgi:S-adenosylmethionine:tRNA ribosyltransferase-isomerase
MSLRTADYDFDLPDELIARYPAEQRDGARMLVVRQATGEIQHAQFRDLPQILTTEDLTVLNNARVIPARVFSDDGRIELLVLDPRPDGHWQCMVKPGRKMRPGHTVTIGGCVGEVLSILDDGTRVIHFASQPDLEKVGHLPLPPYFGRDAEASDAIRYQTVYATAPGAVAAPTAGLHFTSEMLARLPHVFVTLQVGAGTFRGVHADDLTGHIMHSEKYWLPDEVAARINEARSVFAVGTTTVRVLESCAQNGVLIPGEGETQIFIHPPYQFQIVDKLLTNFHLPRSTLLMLVSAFAGRELILEAYTKAVEARYRFYSYGDCMLLL